MMMSCPSLAQIPGFQDRTVLINGFSKAYAMTGLRLGYLATTSPQLARAVTTIQSQLTSCAGSLSQAAGVAALEEVADEEIAAAVAVMRAKRDYVLERLEKMEGVHVPAKPKGAFYVLAEIDRRILQRDDSDDDDNADVDFCVRLLRDQKLALVPGSAFGAPGTVRLSYATSLDELETALDKLDAFLQQERNAKL